MSGAPGPRVTQPPVDAQRSRELDLLRAVAILLVLGNHMRRSRVADLPSFMGVWSRCGWMGVDLFFVLSGFLVSGLLLKEHQRFGRIQLGRFLVRRGLKIYPAFYLLTALAALATLGPTAAAMARSESPFFHSFLQPAFGKLGWAGVGWPNLAAEALFVQNYLPGFWPHTWSLAVEEHFYLLLGVGLWWRARTATRSFEGLGLLTAGLSVLLLLLRIEHFSRTHRTCAFTHLRLDSLLFGVWLSHAFLHRREAFDRFVARHAALIAVLSLWLLVPCMLVANIDTNPFGNTFGYTLNFLGFGGLLALAVSEPRVRRLLRVPAAVLAPIGVYSYCIYLFHIPVRRTVDALADRSPWLESAWTQFGVYAATSIVVGIAISRLLEIPVLHLRDRLFPSRVSSEA